MISGMRKEQVLVLERGAEAGQIIAQHPEIDPRGMGVSGILKSSMFGLRTTLDLPTQAKLDERFELAAKTDRSDQDEARFRELSDDLSDDGFAQDFRDDNYQRYAAAMATVRVAGRVVLSKEEMEQIDAEALDAVRKLAHEVSAS